MSRISLWISLGLFFAGLAWAVAMELGKEWFAHHGYVLWWLFGAAIFFFVLALTDWVYDKLKLKHQSELVAAFERGRLAGAQISNSGAASSSPKNSSVSMANASRPEASLRITGVFYNMRLIRYGMISEARTNGNRWVFCGLRIDVSLSISGPESVEIKDIQLRTYKNKPPSRSHRPIASPQVVLLEKKYAGQKFEAYPQFEYQYEGRRELPAFVEMVVVDEFGAEHIIHLRDGEQLPVVPVSG